MDKNGIDRNQLCEALGFKYSTVSEWLSAKKYPRMDKIELLAEYFGIKKSDLIEQTIDSDPLSDLISKYDNIKPIKLKRFPMLGEIACGEPVFADEDKEHFVMADMDINADFCLTAKGDSMINARIYEGDIVFIKKMDIVDNGEIAAVIIENEATLKRVYYYPDDGMLQLVAENPKYKPLIYQGEELNHIRILGKAVYFMSAVE
jgi:repressor LexA